MKIPRGYMSQKAVFGFFILAVVGFVAALFLFGWVVCALVRWIF